MVKRHAGCTQRRPNSTGQRQHGRYQRRGSHGLSRDGDNLTGRDRAGLTAGGVVDRGNRGRRCDASQKAARSGGAVLNPGSEIQRAAVTAATTVTVADRPKPGKHDGVSVHVLQGADLITRADVERVDRAVAKISHQEIAAESSPSGGSDGDAPGRIQGSIRHQAVEQIAVEIVYVDKAVTA